VHGQHRHRILLGHPLDGVLVLADRFGPHHQFHTVVAQLGRVLEGGLGPQRIDRGRRETDLDRGAHCAGLGGYPDCSSASGPRVTSAPTATAIRVLPMSSVLRTTRTPTTRPRMTNTDNTKAMMWSHLHSWSNAMNSPAPKSTATMHWPTIKAPCPNDDIVDSSSK